MGERSYLAIGDVLALLREEFPDVTISKIRFLESRGLLVPERTPSGYRKFYDQDVERLRWILRQQREHFLPLKVIKGRLENGMTEQEATAPALFEMPATSPAPAEVAAVHESAEIAEIVLVGTAGSRTTSGATASVAGSHGTSPGARHGRNRAGAVAADSSPEGLAAPAPAGSHRPPATSAASATAARADRPAPGTAAAAPRSAEPTAVRSPAVSSTTKATIAAAGREAARSEHQPTAPARPPSTSAHGAATPAVDSHPEIAATLTAPDPTPSTASAGKPPRATSGLPGSTMSGATHTVAELASASGLEVAGIEDLESFGLIAGRIVAGVRCYDEEAVVVAKLAAGFARFGIEARHLRIFKHAADRQAGLFAQVVSPLLHQRNPEARARAIAELSELSELGESLMRCFTAATLRDLTGG